MSGNRCKKGWWSTNDGWLTDCQEEPQVQILGPGWRKLRAKYGPGSQLLTGWICCAAYHGYFWQDLRCLVYYRWDWLKMGSLPQKSIGLSDDQWLSSFSHLRVYQFLGWAAWCTQRPSSLNKRFGPVLRGGAAVMDQLLQQVRASNTQQLYDDDWSGPPALESFGIPGIPAIAYGWMGGEY